MGSEMCIRDSYLATEEEIRRFMRNASDNIDGELLDGYTI